MNGDDQMNWSLLMSNRLVKHQLKCNFISQAVQSWPLTQRILIVTVVYVLLSTWICWSIVFIAKSKLLSPATTFVHLLIETTHTHIYINILKSVPIKCFSSILICKCCTSAHIASDKYVKCTNTCSHIFSPL